MAAYVYECRFCGEQIEVKQKISEYRRKIDRVCPGCACQVVMDSVPQLSGFHLKGGGWDSRGRGAGVGGVI